VEVVPRTHPNCTEEIPVTINGTDAFVDPISYVIKSAGSPIHCNDVAPPRYKVGGKWYCSYPELKECHDPAMLPVDEVKIDPVDVSDIGLGKSIYTKAQLDDEEGLPGRDGGAGLHRPLGERRVGAFAKLSRPRVPH
jgi:hypothetical protein